MDFQPLEPREMNSCCLGHLVHGISLMAAQLTHTEDGDFVGHYQDYGSFPNSLKLCVLDRLIFILFIRLI